MEFLWLGVRKKLSINNGKGDARRLSSGKETDIHVHTRFVFFHHNDGGGDFGGGVDHTCPIPGPEWQVVHRGSGCLIGQFQIQSTDVLTILGPTEFQGSLSVPPVLQHKMYFRYFVTISSFKKAWPFVWNLNPFIQGCFLPSLVDIGPLVVKKLIKMLNVYDDDNKNNN